jgi:hypothetical protein
VNRSDWGDGAIPVSITKQQVKDSPAIDTAKPVSRQFEIPFLRHYGYPSYWGGSGLWGEDYYPGMMMSGMGYGGSADEYRRALAERERIDADGSAQRDCEYDSHLRSCAAVTGYHVHASDGDIGHVTGFLVDTESWAIRYLIVDTSNWWIGHQVLIAPQWITKLSWAESTVFADLPRQAVRDAPPYDPTLPLDRNAEAGIYGHYGRVGF